MRTFVLTGMILFLAGSCFAQEGYLKSRPMQKLKRGVVNVVTAPLEIPKQVKLHWDDSGTNPIEKTAYLFGGLIKGAAYTVGRVGSGLWDIVTLNLDIPGNNEPLVKPDYVWSDEKE
jgi:putative exosortase-associated protein (TIGR04073 family)